MAPVGAVVASLALVLGVWLGLSGPATTPVDPAGAGDAAGDGGRR